PLSTRWDCERTGPACNRFPHALIDQVLGAECLVLGAGAAQAYDALRRPPGRAARDAASTSERCPSESQRQRRRYIMSRRFLEALGIAVLFLAVILLL